MQNHIPTRSTARATVLLVGIVALLGALLIVDIVARAAA